MVGTDPGGSGQREWLISVKLVSLWRIISLISFFSESSRRRKKSRNCSTGAFKSKQPTKDHTVVLTPNGFHIIIGSRAVCYVMAVGLAMNPYCSCLFSIWHHWPHFHTAAVGLRWHDSTRAEIFVMITSRIVARSPWSPHPGKSLRECGMVAEKCRKESIPGGFNREFQVMGYDNPWWIMIIPDNTQ